ncbi:histone deacetylase complex subunit SAP25 isoform X2 [Mixophyes fleayi]|uniref:histone deacetylase complex subunit SAP25 isoform X2 n=1 Tax=Mixophyes fleayi TaxID=3061075 RepID=UPI003F4E0D65
MLRWAQLDNDSEDEEDEDDFSDEENYRSADDAELLGPCDASVTTNHSSENIHATRTLYHPTFEAYYAAVAILQASETPGMRSRREEGYSVNNGEYYYTDPLLSAGHRVYNCLSPATQDVFGCLRLMTPPPIMSPGVYFSSAVSQTPAQVEDPVVVLCISREAESPVLHPAAEDVLCDAVTTSDPVFIPCDNVGVISPQSQAALGETLGLGPCQSGHTPGKGTSPPRLERPLEVMSHMYSISELEAVSALLRLSGTYTV